MDIVIIDNKIVKTERKIMNELEIMDNAMEVGQLNDGAKKFLCPS